MGGGGAEAAEAAAAQGGIGMELVLGVVVLVACEERATLSQEGHMVRVVGGVMCM